MNNFVPLSKPFFDNDETSEIKDVMDSGWVAQGPKVKEFEDNIANYLGVGYAVALSNCTAGLHLANLSMGIKPGDEVLVSDYTFPATGHSVLYCGAKPIFVDIDPKTYNIDPEKIEEKITEKTKAIIPVHTFGQSAEMDIILKIANTHHLPVIEDAACALGAMYQEKFSGTLGDVGCFSFHARKGITTGEGGMIVTNNKQIAEKIRFLSVFGMKTAWERENLSEFTIPEFHETGYNYKMSDITAAVGVAQLRKLQKIIDRKRALALYWNEQLESIEEIEKPFVAPNSNHIYQSYVCLVDKRIKRNSLILELLRAGVQTQIGTYASHIQPVYQSKDVCPCSLDIFNRSIALPMFYSLDESTIDHIIRKLKRIIGEMK
jgi:dTDP-4-amino-4,6-dideoxygalactose transaminase